MGITNLQLLSPAVLVSYLVMMYISVYPVAMSIRRTNVYEEKSLGLYLPANDEEHASFLGTFSASEGMANRFSATHIREQLGFDLWYVFLGVFLICIIESGQIANTNDYVFPQSVAMLKSSGLTSSTFFSKLSARTHVLGYQLYTLQVPR